MDKWLPPTRSYHFNQPKRPHIFAWLDRSVTIGLAAKLSEVWRKLNQSTPQTTTNISQGVTRHYTTLRFTFALSGTCCSHTTIQSSGLNYIVPSTTSQPPQSTSFQNPIPNHIRFPTRYYIEKKNKRQGIVKYKKLTTRTIFNIKYTPLIITDYWWWFLLPQFVHVRSVVYCVENSIRGTLRNVYVRIVHEYICTDVRRSKRKILNIMYHKRVALHKIQTYGQGSPSGRLRRAKQVAKLWTMKLKQLFFLCRKLHEKDRKQADWNQKNSYNMWNWQNRLIFAYLSAV